MAFLKKRFGFGRSSGTARVGDESKRYCYGDEVKLQLGATFTQGVIKFVGAVFSMGPDEKYTIRYGIECKDPVAGGHNGNPSTSFGRRLFWAREGCGVFILRDQIKSAISRCKKSKAITVGDIIRTKHKGIGLVQFVGAVEGRSEDFLIGVELLAPAGDHIGVVDDVQYFSCLGEEKRGIFCTPKQIREVIHAPDADTFKQVDESCAFTSFEDVGVERVKSSIEEELEVMPSTFTLASMSSMIVSPPKTATADSDEKGIDTDDGFLDSKASTMILIDSLDADEDPSDSRIDASSVGATSKTGGLRTESAKKKTARRKFHDFYDFDMVNDFLGEGAFAHVYKCYSKKKRIGAHRRVFAVKRIGKSQLLALERKLRQDLLLRLRDEVRHLKKLRLEQSTKRRGFRNLMHFVDAFENEVYLYVVTNYCSGGTLFDWIRRFEGGVPEKECQIAMRQVLEALAFLNENDIAHLDLNPNNIMIVKHPRTGEEIFQLIDFGMARVIPRLQKSVGSICGTPHFIAPEVLEGRYDPLADMWSVGVILFMLMFGYPPFFDTDPKGVDAVIFRKIKEGFTAEERPGSGPWFPASHRVTRTPAVRDLISKLLVTALADRLPVVSALEHEWLQMDAFGEHVLAGDVHCALISFTSQCKFRILMSRMFSENLTEAERVKVRQVFHDFDTSGDGVIDKKEFVDGMAKFKLGYDVATLEDMFKAIDVNNDGTLDIAELMTAFAYQSMAVTDARLEKVFEELDYADTGYITKAALEKHILEMQRREQSAERAAKKRFAAAESGGGRVRLASTIDSGYEQLSEAVRQAIAFADEDGDGKISKVEFMKIMHPSKKKAPGAPVDDSATYSFMWEATVTAMPHGVGSAIPFGESDDDDAGGFAFDDLYGDSSDDDL